MPLSSQARGVEDFQRDAQQRIAKAQHRLRVASGQSARQVVGEDQQQGAGDQPAEPWTILRPGVDRQQRAEDHHRCAAQAVAQDQAMAREVQAGGGLVALARSGAQGQQVLLRGLDGGKQCRP